MMHPQPTALTKSHLKPAAPDSVSTDDAVINHPTETQEISYDITDDLTSTTTKYELMLFSNPHIKSPGKSICFPQILQPGYLYELVTN